MAADNSPPGNAAPNDVTVAVSNEALLKAESFVEQEEGAANRLMGWAGKISTTIAVVNITARVMVAKIKPTIFKLLRSAMAVPSNTVP